MKRSLPLLAWMLCASSAFAEPPHQTHAPDATSALVKEKLLAPVVRARSKRSRFSRAAPVAREHRVRVLDSEAQLDARGRKFVRFAVDEHSDWHPEGEWSADVYTGCAYPDEGHVYVRRGDVYVPAKSLLGKGSQPVDGVCRAASRKTS